ncbi:MAG TPA: PQQ-binding-like beta-propeller repeat protein [Gaiellaceae bacterium]|nr:PQQ-binding-like beta-propeller repeat protein [Gaiellaceae bacterium]
MRRLLVVAGLLVLFAGAATAYYVSHHRFGGNVRGSSTEFVPTETVPAPAAAGGLVSPMFGGEPEHLHVASGRVRPPYRLDWISGGTSLIEFQPAVAFGYLYYATFAGNLIAVSAKNGRRLWLVPFHRCEASSPAVSHLFHGTVFETFLNSKPCGRGAANSGNGELVAVAAGRPHTIRWRKRLAGASETSPLIVGHRIYIGDAKGNVYCLHMNDGKTLWRYQAGGAVKGALAYDHGEVFFGAYDGYLYALRARTGKRVWRTPSARDLFGDHGTFYSTPSVAYSRVYLGSTDGKVYSFGERTGRVRWSYATGGYVYGSPAVWDSRVFVGSYSHYFYAFDAATGDVLWRFHANGAISGSASVVNGIVYFATVKRKTYALDARTGKQVWTWHDGKFASVVSDGSRLYVVGYGKVYAFSPRHRLQSSK